MPHKVMQVKVGDEWTTLGRVKEEGARKYVALTVAGITSLEANPITDEGVERAGKTLTVTASYVRRNASACRVILEKDAASVDDQKAAADAPKKKASKKKAKAGDAGND